MNSHLKFLMKPEQHKLMKTKLQYLFACNYSEPNKFTRTNNIFLIRCCFTLSLLRVCKSHLGDVT